MERVVVRFGNAWIKSLSYAPGEGLTVTRVTYTRNRAEAARFIDSGIAGNIALQFYTKPATLETASGERLVEETAAVRRLAHEKLQLYLASRQEVKQEFEKALREIAPQIRKALGSTPLEPGGKLEKLLERGEKK